MNRVEEYVQENASNFPDHQYVADHGRAITAVSERDLIAGYQVRLSEEITQSDRSLIKAAIQAVEPDMKKCFASSLKMWEYNPRFKYAEGFAVPSDIADVPLEHAWCMLDGSKLIDFTPEFQDHYGVIFTSESVLKQYTGSKFTPQGIIGNHSHRHEFLRKRGYKE